MPASIQANPQGNCGYYKIEKHEDGRGCLWVVPEPPFEVKHHFVVTNLNGVPRGNHAHREASQVIWVSQGQAKAVLQRGGSCNIVHLIPDYAIVVGPKTWVTLCGFTPDCVYQVWSNVEYDESEYIRDPAEFGELTGQFPRPVFFAEGQVHVGDPHWIS